jgi:hypothetical protein
MNDYFPILYSNLIAVRWIHEVAGNVVDSTLILDVVVPAIEQYKAPVLVNHGAMI